MNRYRCDTKFSGNISVVGKTGCGKQFFVQKLALNNMFGKAKELDIKY